MWGALEHGVDIATDVVANICRCVEDIDVARNGEITLQLGLVYLRNGADTEGLLLEFFKYLLEWPTIEGSLDDFFCSVKGMRRGVRVEFGQHVA